MATPRKSTKPNKTGRILKTEVNLKVDLNPEQKNVVSLFHQFDVNFVLGDFGSGKTLVGVHTAVTCYRKKMFNKIWITRPMLKNNLAALPGDVSEKMAPYTFPIVQNIEVCQGRDLTTKMMTAGEIEILPIEVAKGVTFMDSVVIVDEFQDMTYEDFRTILTRVGKDSKIFFCGSKQQIDPKIGMNSCYYKIKQLEHSGLVGFTTLTSNHRNPILSKIIEYLEPAI